jgi:Protein of unknown function (DUF4058)
VGQPTGVPFCAKSEYDNSNFEDRSMPLRDHFHPPVSLRKNWEGFHSGWAFLIAQRLNGGVLKTGYESQSQIHIGSQIEIDVATHEEDRGTNEFGSNGNGGLATKVQTYAPPAPPLSEEVAFADADLFEVQIYKTDGGSWKLVSAVELVSPANKDRPSRRRAFATKIASYLQQGVSVVVVDLVTERRANLHAELVELLHLPDTFDWQSASGLSAVAYRVVKVKAGDKEQERLDVWPYPLALGEALPTVPLWLNPVLAVPLELELTYANACQSLRIE